MKVMTKAKITNCHLLAKHFQTTTELLDTLNVPESVPAWLRYISQLLRSVSFNSAHKEEWPKCARFGNSLYTETHIWDFTQVNW